MQDPTATVNLTAAAVISFTISFLKKQSWFPWLTADTEKLNRMVAIGLSAFAALGVDFEFNHAAGTLVITGLHLTAILVACWHMVVQFVYTHGWFKATSASDQIVCLFKAIIKAQAAGEPAAPAASLPATSGASSSV